MLRICIISFGLGAGIHLAASGGVERLGTVLMLLAMFTMLLLTYRAGGGCH